MARFLLHCTIMRKNYTLVQEKESTEVEGANYMHLLNGNHRTFKASLLISMLMLIYPYIAMSQTGGNTCGAHTSFLVAGDSLMISHQLLSGATNYSLKVRKSTGGEWFEPVGDVASGCSRINYFVLYLRNKPNDCQKSVLKPGAYLFKVTAYNDLIDENCEMHGDFYLSEDQVWKSTYSSWDVVNMQSVPVLKK